MAEAFFNSMDGDKARAISAGTQPTDSVNPVVVEAMQTVGLDISGNRPRLLTTEMLRQADRVISMGCLDEGSCPARLVPTEDWGLPDPHGLGIAEVIKIRDMIKERVILLLKDL